MAKKKTTQPAWMKKRIKQVDFLRSRGWDSASLAQMTETEVEKAYNKEIKNEKA